MIILFRAEMWQGGEQFDEPGDFDEAAIEEQKSNLQIQNQESRQMVSLSNNIHITLNVNGVGLEARADPIVNSEATNMTDWPVAEGNLTDVTELGDGKDEILQRTMDVVKEMVQKETEKTGQAEAEYSIVYIVVGAVIGCLVSVICICIYVCYR